MAATEATLGTPVTPNLKELAESTASTFTILRPWCKAKFKSNALILIQKQAQSYVKAIDFSITAAQHGYNITQEALAFSELVDFGDEKDRQQYLCGMLGIARQGEKHAQLASEKFRSVRSTVEELIFEAREHGLENEHSNPTGRQFLSTFKHIGLTLTSAFNCLSDLEGGLSALEKFSNSISSYVSWWNVINMSHLSQTTRLDEITVNYHSLRYRGVIKKWKELGEEYIEYSTKIQAIQDSYPDFALELSKATSEGLLTGSEPMNNVDQGTAPLEPPAYSLMTFHFPGTFFAARNRDQHAGLKKRERMRDLGRKFLSLIRIGPK